MVKFLNIMSRLRLASTIHRNMSTTINLSERNSADNLKWLDSFDTVLTDCDGVLWIHNTPIPGSPEVITKLQTRNKKVYLVTNNSQKTREEIAEKAGLLGISVTNEEVICTSYAVAHYLRNRKFNQKVYVIGSQGISDELNAVGIDNFGCGADHMQSTLLNFLTNDFKLEQNVGAVVVGFDGYFSFPKITKAASYLSNPNCLFIATNTDERFPMPNCIIPGTGSLVRAVEVASERSATIIGKPNPYICEFYINSKIIIPEKTLMIGDRTNTDILMGKNCGFKTLLVGTGIHNMDDVRRYEESDIPSDKNLIPDFYVPSLGDLMRFL